MSLQGQLYLVTFATHRRHPVFADEMLAQTACRAMTDPRLWRDAALLAWVLMPDHWHGLIELRDTTISRRVQSLKSNSARRVNEVLPRNGASWATAFHDHALRREEDVVEAARYVVMNPVRAGLVERARDYPFWDSVYLDT